MKISIIIPCFNEEKFIIETLKKVNKQRENFDIQIIVSDDCSTDKTIDLLNKNTNLYDDIIISERNKGKGSAIKNAIPLIKGDITLIQDADLEYNPKDYTSLFNPFIEDDADEEYEDMYVKTNFENIEYGGPLRGGKYLEPTRFGDWEQKGRCSDY